MTCGRCYVPRHEAEELCEGSVGIDSMWRCRQNTQVDKPEDATVVDLQEPVSLSFALRYLNSFAKASPLSSQVQKSLLCAFQCPRSHADHNGFCRSHTAGVNSLHGGAFCRNLALPF